MKAKRVKRLEQIGAPLAILKNTEPPLFLERIGEAVATPQRIVRGLERALKLAPQEYPQAREEGYLDLPINSPLVESYNPSTGELYLKELPTQFFAVWSH